MFPNKFLGGSLRCFPHVMAVLSWPICLFALRLRLQCSFRHDYDCALRTDCTLPCEASDIVCIADLNEGILVFIECFQETCQKCVIDRHFVS